MIHPQVLTAALKTLRLMIVAELRMSQVLALKAGVFQAEALTVMCAGSWLNKLFVHHVHVDYIPVKQSLRTSMHLPINDHGIQPLVSDN